MAKKMGYIDLPISVVLAALKAWQKKERWANKIYKARIEIIDDGSFELDEIVEE